MRMRSALPPLPPPPPPPVFLPPPMYLLPLAQQPAVLPRSRTLPSLPLPRLLLPPLHRQSDQR